jgi:flagellar M-ring protein FliF
VSSSVPELDPKSVTVVDQRGNLLSAANAGARGLDVSQLKYTQEIEQGYIRRIEAILQPIVGTGNVHAQVAADIDFSVVEHTDEKFRPNADPANAAIRSHQSSESLQTGGTPPGGVPGALSNQPPTAPNAPITTPPNAPPTAAQAAAQRAGTATTTTTAPASTGPSNSRKDGTTNYELDRSIRHVQQGAGGVKRLSVAVVVNNRATDDKGAGRALTPAEVDQIRNLAKEAVGFSQDRGDSLNVVNSAFADEREKEAPPVPFYLDRANIPLAMQLGTYLLIAIAALFAWFAIGRPLLRKHLAPPPPPPVAALDENDVFGKVAAEEGPTPDEALRQREAERHKADLDFALEAATQDPKLVAIMIQHWMTTDEQ